MMNVIRIAFLEDPMYVYIALAISFLMLVAIYYERRSPYWAWSLVIPPVLGVLVLTISTLVVTDRERITLAAREIARSLESGSAKNVLPYLDEDFTVMLHSNVLGKVDVREVAERELSKFDVTRIKVTKVRVEIGSPRARMHAVTIISWRANGIDGSSSIIWDVDWIERDEGWQILKVDEPCEGIEF